MIFTKHRFEIWNQTQHPYKHSLGDFSYFNPAAPGVSNVESAFNWLFAVLYPQTQAAVANVAALPLLGNTLNDFRVVQDDGDGNAAAYRWEQREGELSPSWHKIYDMDWGSDSILEAFQLRTQDLYVHRRGYDDIDNAGAAITGVYAGQTVIGGLAANSNLTLRANAGDGTGAQTGYVQVDDNFRPAQDDTWDVGTVTERFKVGYFSGSVVVDTLTISGGLITDSTGTISFFNENLTTSGDITGGVVTGTSLVADDAVDTITIVPGLITDTTGLISFGSTNLSTTGTLAAGVTTLTDNAQTIVLDPDVAGAAQITSSTGTISFDNEDLITTGNFTVGTIIATSLEAGNIDITGNTISSIDVNGNIILAPNGTGIVDVQKTLVTLNQTVTGTVSITGQLNADNLRIDGNIISSTNTNGNITLDPNGTGVISVSADVLPDADDTYNLGSTSLTFSNLYIKGSVSDGTDSITALTLLSLRNTLYRDAAQTLPAQAGDSLFYDTVSSTWLASAPDSEIDHSTLSGLVTGDAGHTQFAMLAGRAGGQTLQGGTAASNNLIFESTSHATKGTVQTKDNFVPFTDASYSGSWSGTDLGDSTHNFRDLYTKGEAFGLRFQNVTVGTLPSSSMQNQGRVVFTTDELKAYIDTGTTFIPLGGGNKFLSDVSFDGIVTTKDVDVSADIDDARTAVWQLKDNANDFESMLVSIKATSVSNVRITTNVPLAAGSYRLIGFE